MPFCIQNVCSFLSIKLIKCDYAMRYLTQWNLMKRKAGNTEAEKRRQILVNRSRLTLQATIKLQVKKRLPFLKAKIISDKPVLNSSAAFFRRNYEETQTNTNFGNQCDQHPLTTIGWLIVRGCREYSFRTIARARPPSSISNENRKWAEMRTD